MKTETKILKTLKELLTSADLISSNYKRIIKDNILINFFDNGGKNQIINIYKDGQHVLNYQAKVNEITTIGADLLLTELKGILSTLKVAGGYFNINGKQFKILSKKGAI